MGLYIQTNNDLNKPEPAEVKLEWLRANGRNVTEFETKITADEVPVCLVYNPGFAAAAVAYDMQELHRFKEPDRGVQRPRVWFMVPREKVRQFAPRHELFNI